MLCERCPSLVPFSGRWWTLELKSKVPNTNSIDSHLPPTISLSHSGTVALWNLGPRCLVPDPCKHLGDVAGLKLVDTHEGEILV